MIGPIITREAISKILNGESPHAPVLQVLAYKKVDEESADINQYRFIMNDGDHMHQFFIMSNPELCDRIEVGEFERYTLIRLLDYHLNHVRGIGVIVIEDVEVVTPGSIVARRIGTPVNIQSLNPSAQ